MTLSEASFRLEQTKIYKHVTKRSFCDSIKKRLKNQFLDYDPFSLNSYGQIKRIIISSRASICINLLKPIERSFAIEVSCS